MNFAYDRTSLQDASKVSNDAQYQKSVATAKKENHYPIQRYSDEGFSGSLHDRPAFNQLKEAIKSSYETRILYVWKYDRIARDVNVALSFLDLCEKHNVEVRSVNEPLPVGTINNRATQKMFVQLLFTMAEFQRSVIIENILLGLGQRKSKGLYISSKPPYGYRLQNRGELVQVKSEADIVKKIFDVYCEGELGYKKIADLMNSKYDYKGKPFKAMTIHLILTKEVYYGLVKGGTLGSYIGNFEPIVSKEQFEKATAIRKSHTTKKKDTREYLLKKKIVCCYCGWKLTPKMCPPNKQGIVHHYYHCANRKCQSVSMRAEVIEGQVIECLRSFLIDDQVMPALLANIKGKIHEIKRQEQLSENAILKKKDRLFRKFEREQITQEEFVRELSKLANSRHSKNDFEIGSLESRLKDLLSLKSKEVSEIIVDKVTEVELAGDKKLKGVRLDGGIWIEQQ